jgi:saccharopepsin
MGVRPQNHFDAVFNGMKVEASGNHPVPISNFMNAQCKKRFW